jgi:L-ascorbate metabolism protein UlaG (beta-lactamase superfamily)
MTNDLLHNRELSARKAEAIREYPNLWMKIIQEWREASEQDHAWLIYSANYLLRTANILWAVDPLVLHSRLPEAAPVEVACDLEKLDFVLLTHNHADHLDLRLIEALKDHPIRWVIPDFLMKRVVERTGLSLDKIIIPAAGVSLDLSGIQILPFESAHWEITPNQHMEGSISQRRGVPELGYLVECGGKHWLFPGDIRCYDRSLLPPFPHLDVVFAHIWMGRSQAVLDDPPLLQDFCRFFSSFDTEKIILTHLDEFYRAPENLWDSRHANLITEYMSEKSPALKVNIAWMGDRVSI